MPPPSAESVSKYRAPALEKGLDVLELLARANTPMTLSQISARLERSVSELFRMVQVLEARGYVSSASSGEGFELTNKMFSVGVKRGPSQNLLVSALPMMQALSEQTRQACHLAIVSEDSIVVIARIEAPGALGFSVRVGHRCPLVHSNSGLVIFAFQKLNVREQWRTLLRQGMSAEKWGDFEHQAERAREQGYFTAPSEYIDGITDISCPVSNDIGTIAALTIPYIHVRDGITMEGVLLNLKDTARNLSKGLGGLAH